MEQLIFVSCDSHAGIPKEQWSEYLDPAFHDLLPRLREDNEVYPTAISVLSAHMGASDLPEVREAHDDLWHGLHDAVLRTADMDREGVAAELIFHGDFRLGDLFHNATSSLYPIEAWEAGARGWNRWASENFAFARDRFLPVGAIGPCVDLDRTVEDLSWIADNGFVGTYAPNFMRHVDTPELFDPYWDPFWSACEDLDLAVVVHAGYGWEQGIALGYMEDLVESVAAATGSRDLDVMRNNGIGSIPPDSIEFLTDLARSLRPRRPLWQMLLGGVFDRHPRLRLLLSEIRLDWIPATLAHLDGLYAANRAELPGLRPPSEYWAEHCMAGASFMHKAEVERRHEIGVETIAFGRDYPHPEGTWPNTTDWLHDAFAPVPDDELRLMLGENLIRFLGLDRARLAEIARRIGPTVDEVKGRRDPVRPELIESFAQRGGYLKPFEGDARLADMDAMIQPDLAALR